MDWIEQAKEIISYAPLVAGAILTLLSVSEIGGYHLQDGKKGHGEKRF